MQTEVNLAKVRMSNAGSPSFPWLSQIQPSTDPNICVAGMMAQSGESLQKQGKKQTWWLMLLSIAWGCRDRKIPGTLCSVSLAFYLSERPCLKI